MNNGLVHTMRPVKERGIINRAKNNMYFCREFTGERRIFGWGGLSHPMLENSHIKSGVTVVLAIMWWWCKR